jgi:NOL1/NOP2/fmu family ribosome biogenesis protein
LPTFASEAERREILDYFSDHFGIPEKAFEGFCFLMGERKIWVVQDHPELERTLEQLKVESVGIPLLRTKTSMWKPTTAGLHFFGHHATRNVFDLGQEDLADFLKGEPRQAPPFIESGFVIVRWREKVLGCAVCGKGKLRSQIPHKRREPFISSYSFPKSKPPLDR